MYVFDINSPSDQLKPYADFLIIDINKIITESDLNSFSNKLGPIIAGDRWKPYEPLLVSYFCSYKEDIFAPEDAQNKFSLSVEYLINNRKRYQKTFKINCAEIF